MRATRTDVGTENARTHATAVERMRPDGTVARNPRSDCEWLSHGRPVIADRTTATYDRSEYDRMIHPNKDGS
ncbi:MAG: hypothetical protein ACXVGB_00275 [Mycobacteriaceae bacterium]